MNRGAKLLAVATLVAVGAFASAVVSEERAIPDVASMSAEEIVALRIEIMKEDGKLLVGAMQAPGGEAGAKAGVELVHNVGILKSLFPEGSLTPDSNSLESIWTEKEAFDAMFDTVAAEGQKMADAAAAGDNAAFMAALQAAGKVCSECHTKWRKPL